MWRLRINKFFAVGLLMIFMASILACQEQAPAPKKKSAKKEKTAPKGKKPGREGEDSSAKTGLEAAEEERWRYDPSDKWDPFVIPTPPIITGPSSERFDLEQMLLQGIIRGSGMDAAYIILPDGSDRIVRIGDVLGKHGGEVKDIGEDYLIVEERYMDPNRPHDTFIIEKELKLVEVKKGKRR